ncbi:hypothetical protein ACOME3_007167 [Neoechinorhynchus agilis]
MERHIRASQDSIVRESRRTVERRGLPLQPVYLYRPLSRYQGRAPSLKYLCRLLIRGELTSEGIDKLPIPLTVRCYCKETQIYVRDEVLTEIRALNEDQVLRGGGGAQRRRR